MSVENMRIERGQELKALRKSKGISQVKLAKVSHISHATIVRMETGKWNYGVDNEFKFRKILSEMPDKIKKVKKSPGLLHQLTSPQNINGSSK